MIALIPEWLQTAGEEIGSFWPIIVALIFLAALARWGIRYIVNEQTDTIVGNVNERVSTILDQFETNGGTTAKDSLNRIEDNQNKNQHKIDRAISELREIQVKLDILSLSHEITAAKVRALVMGIEEVGFWTTDKTGLKTVEANSAYMSIWGFTDISQIGTDEWMLLLTDESRERATERLESIANHPRHWVYEMDLKDGRVIRISGWPIFVGSDFNGYTGILEEVKDIA